MINHKLLSLKLMLAANMLIGANAQAADNFPTRCNIALRVAKKDTRDLRDSLAKLDQSIGKELVKEQDGELNEKKPKYRKNILFRTLWNYKIASKGRKTTVLIRKSSPDGESLNVPAFLVLDTVMAKTVVALIHKGEFKWITAASKADKKSEQQVKIESLIETLDSYQPKLLQQIITNRNLEHEKALISAQLGIRDRIKNTPYIGKFFVRPTSAISHTDANDFITPQPYRLVVKDKTLTPVDIFNGNLNPTTIEIVPYTFSPEIQKAFEEAAQMSHLKPYVSVFKGEELNPLTRVQTSKAIEIYPYKSLDITKQEASKDRPHLSERLKEIKHKLKGTYVLDHRVKLEVDYLIALNKMSVILDELLLAQKIYMDNNTRSAELDKVINILVATKNKHSVLMPTFRAQNQLMKVLLEAQKAKKITNEYADDLIGYARQYLNLINGDNKNSKELEEDAHTLLNTFGLNIKELTTPKKIETYTEKAKKWAVRAIWLATTATGVTTGGNQLYKVNEGAINQISSQNKIEDGSYLTKAYEGFSEGWSTWVTHEHRIFRIVNKVEGDDIYKNHEEKSREGANIVEDYIARKHFGKKSDLAAKEIRDGLDYYHKEFDRRLKRAIKDRDNERSLAKAHERKLLELKMLNSEFKKASAEQRKFMLEKLSIFSTTTQDLRSMSKTELETWQDNLISRIEDWSSRFFEKESRVNREKFISLISDLIQKKDIDSFTAITTNKLELPENMYQETMHWADKLIETSDSFERFKHENEVTEKFRKAGYFLEDIQKFLGSFF